jgi:phosphoenolpyruvate-protein phosphotransferase/dihydroxyacetone kinase phosphotransfer subunit
MVGLVIVSHSRALAHALVDLVNQVSTVEIPMALAAGVGPERNEFGTDAVEIMEAIQAVYSEDGVLVLMDLGSAILSAEMALELLPSDIAENIRFCAAPVVEGAIAAGVQIGLGSDLETACLEAKSSLLPKIEHLSGAEESFPEGVIAKDLKIQPDAEEIVLTLKNLHGLHARPAARLVQTAAGFDANVQVRNLANQKGPVSAKSLNALATLGAVRDHQIAVTASGVEAKQALKALSELVEDNFGESPEEAIGPPPVITKPATSPAEGAERAVAISEGLALGPIFHYQAQPPPVSQESAEDPDVEWQRFEQALSITRTVIRQRRSDLVGTIGEVESAIFDAHLLILQDPDLLERVRSSIFEGNQNAAAAWDANIKEIAKNYQSLDDPYLQQRAADVLDVGNQVLFALSDKTEAPVMEFSEPVILFAHELTPTETSQLDMSQVLGIVTVGGGPTSHSAILARALGIPAVSGVSVAFEKLVGGSLCALDGFNGDIWIDPSEKIQQQVQEGREAWLAQRERLLKTSHELAVTRDGVRIEVVANVGNVMDARAATKNGAEGIGLLRTEFLYLTRESPPSEDQQVETLLEIGKAMSSDGNTEAPIIVRTLDVGGDKELPYLPMPAEANPFLGVRAIRLSLRNQDIFMTQLRAILRAGDQYCFKVMFPMVANLGEVLEARRLLEEAHRSLVKDELPHRWPIDTGIMVEVPSAALHAPVLAQHVDFFSIGTNDLTQYTMAAERGNPELSELADAFHPVVLRLVNEVAKAAHKHGKWVGVCGELAGDPLAVAVLVGLGVDELSMNPGAIPRAKAILRASGMDEIQALAKEVQKAQSAAEVREIADDFIQGRLE